MSGKAKKPSGTCIRIDTNNFFKELRNLGFDSEQSE